MRITFCNYDVYDDEKILKSKHQGRYSPWPLKVYLENITVSTSIRIEKDVL